MRWLVVMLVFLIPVTSFANNVKEIRKIDDFDSIEVMAAVDVLVNNSATADAVLEGQRDWVKWVHTEVRNNTLYVSLSEDAPFGWFQNRRANLTVNTSNLKSVVLKGGGNIALAEFAGNALKLRIQGSGDISMRAAAFNSITLEVLGSGDIDLGKLTTETVTTSVSGSGDVRLSNIDASMVSSSIRGSGDIRLAGTVDRQIISIHGSGDVRSRQLRVSDVDVTIYGSGDVFLPAGANIERSDIYGSGDINID